MKFLKLFCITLVIFLFCSCSQGTANGNKNDETNNDIYADSQYLGKWYNADTADEILVIELNADGTALYEGTHKGTWTENVTDDITINLTIDEKETTMTGYFVISGEGFVARATDENMHYVDEGKGELQLEIMLTEKTCVDCVKKD